MSRKFKTIGLALMLGAIAGTPQAFAEAMPMSAASQQAAVCEGTVLDDTGEPVIGATVMVVGTNKAVNTDLDGKFRLGNIPTGSTLKVSYVGYADAEAKWNGQPVTINLKPSENMLDEMVVVGYGVVRKADLAGSVSVLDNKAFAAQPITQAAEALQGRVAGVTVISDGLPGGSVKIRIRGSNSINKSNDPLYVVDGMVRETGLDGINPEDIQSMQVLKDASSTAIYGSRGANGVVLITTKTAARGATQITFDASVGINNAVRLPDAMNAQEYAESLRDWNNIVLTDYLNGTDKGTNWGDEIFQTGVTQNYRLVVAKGTENNKIYFSANYLNNKGTLIGTQYERYTAKLNASTSLTKWLDATIDMQASHGIGKGAGGMEVGGYNPIYLAFNYSPTMDVMTPDGQYYNWDPYGSINANPVGQLVGAQSERRRDVFAGHVDLRFKIIPGLTFTTSNGVDYFNRYNYNFTPASYNINTKNISSSNANMQRMLLQSVNNLTYVGTFNEKHNLTATAVWEATKSSTRSLSGSANNMQTGSVGWWNFAVGQTIGASNGYSDWSLLSAVGRVIYNYDNRYMITGTFRADGSSRFTNNKWGYFPSAAVAWTVSNENFMESIRPVLSNLKLRTSFGVVGNQDITPYSTLANLNQTSMAIGTISTPYVGYWNNKIATPDLKWEKTNQFDFGIDASFLNGRFDISLDYFYKITSDALLLTSSAQYLGGSQFYINAGKVRNTGFDFAVNATIIQGRDWTWSTSINGGYLKNKVVKMTADTPALYAGSLQSIVNDFTIVTEGEPIGAFFGWEWAGIENGLDVYYDKDGNKTTTPAFEDRKVLGKAAPDFTLGWNNTITYKNWSLNAFFSGAFGQQRLNVLRFAMASKIGNSRAITLAGYQNMIGKTMADPTNPAYAAYGESSKYVEDADYFRLDNLSLAYDFSKKDTKFADLRLSVSVQNLFTITNYKGSNPASYPFSDNLGERGNGVDTGTYPTNRIWTVGVRMNF